MIDGARHALELGIKTLKINLSRGSLIRGNNETFYNLPNSEIDQIKTLADAVNSPSIKTVLDMDFETVFIDADNISLDGRTNNYWNFESQPMQAVDKEAIKNETYDMAVALLNNYKSESKTFVIQNHEGDSHASISVHPQGVPSAIGIQNFKDYWRIRQKAIAKARRDVPSRSKVYHMCEVTSVRKPMFEGQQSLTTDVLPYVACDLVGYSAHDTANDSSGGANLLKAIDFIRKHAQNSPVSIFGSNRVLISEIAVPEKLKGVYRYQTDPVARQIAKFLEEGMPWVLYWQLYESGIDPKTNDYKGNWLIKPDRSKSLMFNSLVKQFAGKNQRRNYLEGIRELSTQYFGEISADNEAVSLQLDVAGREGSLARIEESFAWIKESWARYYGAVPDYAYVDAEMNYLLAGRANDATKRTLENLIRVEAAKLKGENDLTAIPAAECNFNGNSIAVGGEVQAFMAMSVPAGQVCASQTRVCNSDGTLSGSFTYTSCTVAAVTPVIIPVTVARCSDIGLIASSDSGALPSGVSAEVKRTYWQLLGGIGPHLAGARYITSLREQGYTMKSLRKDIINDPAISGKINDLYQHYLKRDIHAADFENVKIYLNGGGNMRVLELQIVNSAECE